MIEPSSPEIFYALGVVRKAGLDVIRKDAVHDIRSRSTHQDMSIVDSAFDVERYIKRAMTEQITNELLQAKLIRWRYTQNAAVGSLIVEADLTVLDKKWINR